MDYKIIENESSSGLEKEVKALIVDGWRPTGGVTLTAPPDFTSQWTYIQAMIRE